MSDYNEPGSVFALGGQEPPTSGKIVINTNYGELEIELWCKEAPRTCRNFVQLILDRYYVIQFFHRVVPGFIVQGGIPINQREHTIYEDNFIPLEIHSRLHFSRRGLLATAVTGRCDKNECWKSVFLYS